MELVAAPGPDGQAPAALFCENETNVARLFGAAAETPYPKDGINDHVVSGAATVNPARTGTKCAFWYQITLDSGASAELRGGLRPAQTGGAAAAALGALGSAPGTAAAWSTAGALGAEFETMRARRR